MSALGNRSIDTEGANLSATDVKVSELANLVGFPVEYLKAELFIEGEELSLESLREKVLAYLDRSVSTNQEF